MHSAGMTAERGSAPRLPPRAPCVYLENEHRLLTPAAMPSAVVRRPQEHERAEAEARHIFWAAQFRYDCERDVPAEGAGRGGISVCVVALLDIVL